jgi:hypothetical protein
MWPCAVLYVLHAQKHNTHIHTQIAGLVHMHRDIHTYTHKHTIFTQVSGLVHIHTHTYIHT